MNHSEREYVRGEVHTNTAESYAAHLERILIGVFHRMSKAHMDQYLAEASFRRNAKCELQDEQGDPTSEYARLLPLHQITTLFRNAVGCELRRSEAGGVRRPDEANTEPRGRIMLLNRKTREAHWAALAELLDGLYAFESLSLRPVVESRPRRRRRRVRG